MRLISVLFACYSLFGCQNLKNNTNQQADHLKDYISIHSHSIQDTFKFSKAKFKLIINSHPEINLYPPLNPDLAYQKNNKGFISETGQDVYYTIYAYLLEKNNINSKQLRIKLIEAFHKVNSIHGVYKRGGSFFGHQKARIAAYAEFVVYSFRHREPTLEYFKKNKSKYIDSLKVNFEKGIVQMVNTPEKSKTFLLKDINLEISHLEKLIDNDIMLKAVRDFEQKYYNYKNVDPIW
jgi:hypothetical protein